MPEVDIVVANQAKTQWGQRMLIETTDHLYRYYTIAAPVNIQYGGYGYVWTQVPRPGKMPYLLMESWQLPTVTFSLEMADENNPDYDCTAGLKQLGYMAATSRPIRIVYGGYFENRVWRMTTFNFESKRRHPDTNVITWATINLEFTMANDVVLSTGPTTGGVA